VLMPNSFSVGSVVRCQAPCLLSFIERAEVEYFVGDDGFFGRCAK